MCSGEAAGTATHRRMTYEADHGLLLAQQGFGTGSALAALPDDLDFFHSYSSFVVVVAYAT